MPQDPLQHSPSSTEIPAEQRSDQPLKQISQTHDEARDAAEASPGQTEKE